MTGNYVFLSDVREHPALPERGILSETLHSDDKARIIRFCFAPGEGLSAHAVPVPAILYFAQGQASLTLGDEVKEVGEGAFIAMAPGLQHSIEAKSEVVMLLVMMKNAPAGQ